MTAEAGGVRLLLVRCGERTVAIPAGSLVRVLGPTTVSPVPGSAPELLGLAQVEGEPVVVLDLARLLGEIPAPSASIPAGVQVRLGENHGGETLALAVDEALEFVTVPEGAVRREAGEGPVAGVVTAGGRTAALLDPARLGGGAA